jgi:ribosomal protein S21
MFRIEVTLKDEVAKTPEGELRAKAGSIIREAITIVSGDPLQLFGAVATSSNFGNPLNLIGDPAGERVLFFYLLDLRVTVKPGDDLEEVLKSFSKRLAQMRELNQYRHYQTEVERRSVYQARFERLHGNLAAQWTMVVFGNRYGHALKQFAAENKTQPTPTDRYRAFGSVQRQVDVHQLFRDEWETIFDGLQASWWHGRDLGAWRRSTNNVSAA